MSEIAISSLMADLLRDLQRPDMVWQAVIVSVCLLVGWLLERRVRARQVDVDARRAWRIGHGGVKRLIFPLTALILIVLLRATLKPWLHVNLLSLAVPLLASLAIIRFVFYVLRVTFSDSAWLVSFERIFAMLVWFGVVLHITGFLPELIDALEELSFSVGKQKLNLWLILQGLGAVAVSLLLALWMGSVVETRLMGASGMDANLQVVFSRLSKAGFILLAVIVSLPLVGIDLTALSVFGGAIGVGLGFGLQKIASNYVAGFIILLDRSIRIGNVIAVGADKGRVTEITTRYTVLRAGTGVESLVPNEALVSGVVQNETYSDFNVRHTLAVQISYENDPEQAMAILVAAAQANPNVASDPVPIAFLLAFADSGINLELQFWIDRMEVSGQQVLSDLNLAVWKAFNAAGINIPFPQREVRIISSDLSN